MANDIDAPTIGRVHATVEGSVGWMIFDNPARRNAMSLSMWRDLSRGLQSFAQNPTVRIVVMRGAGETAFISGADISEFESHRGNAAAATDFDQATDDAWKALDAFEKPLIAMISGFCFGGGLAIAMKADMRIAADNAMFCIPAAKLGLAYPPHSLGDLVSLVGPSAAKDILFTARQFGADDALALRLINKCVSQERLDQEITTLCQIIVGNAPLTIAAAKETINQIVRNTPDQRRLAAKIAQCFDSEDYAEGRRAFKEKRRPVFAGR